MSYASLEDRIRADERRRSADEIERLRAALKPFAEHPATARSPEAWADGAFVNVPVTDLYRARAMLALEQRARPPTGTPCKFTPCKYPGCDCERS